MAVSFMQRLFLPALLSTIAIPLGLAAPFLQYAALRAEAFIVAQPLYHKSIGNRCNKVTQQQGRPATHHASGGRHGSVMAAVEIAPGRARELRLMTWLEVEASIARDKAETGSAAVIVPLGATEQHGPNGLIGTDHITAEAVATGVSAATGAILAPSVNFGMSVHHGSFAGTVTLSPSTFVGVVRDVASSLQRSGFTHVLFVNGHGGNVGPTFAAFSEMKASREHKLQEQNDEKNRADKSKHAKGQGKEDGENTESSHVNEAVERIDEPHGNSNDSGTAARLKLINWYAGKESSALAKKLYGDEVGQHATPDEVAMTQHLFPESIKSGVRLDPAAIQVARDLKGMTKRFKDGKTGLSIMDADDFRKRFPDGRMFSNPGLAMPEHGQHFLQAAVRDATEALQKFISGEDMVEAAATAAASKTWQKPRWEGGTKASGAGGIEKGTKNQRTKGHTGAHAAV